MKSRFVGVVLAGTLAITGCSSDSQSASDGSAEVSPYEISRELVPLLDAVATYTNTDYSAGGDSPYTPEIYQAVKGNFAAIAPASRRWMTFSNGLDYEQVAIPGLEAAVDSYNRAVTDWQDVQNASMQVWDQCFAEGGDDMVMSMCLLAGNDIAAEQAALDAYISALTSLFEVLDIPVPSQ
jgi:hypothetical protein